MCILCFACVFVGFIRMSAGQVKWKLQIAHRCECLCLSRRFSISQPTPARIDSSFPWPWTGKQFYSSLFFSAVLLYFIMAIASEVNNHKPLHKLAEWQHICQENNSDAFAIFVSCIVSQILFLPSQSQALTFLRLMEGDGAYRAKKKRKKKADIFKQLFRASSQSCCGLGCVGWCRCVCVYVLQRMCGFSWRSWVCQAQPVFVSGLKAWVRLYG